MALLAVVSGALAMGISPIFVRLGEVGPFAGAFWRVFLALPLLYGWMRYEERTLKTSQKQVFSKPAIIAGLLFFGDLFFWHLAIFGTTVANATFFATTAPIFVGIAGFFVFGRRISRNEAMGIALCLFGGAFLVSNTVSIGNHRLLGDFYGILTAVFFGGYFLAMEVARRQIGAGRLVFESSVISGILLLISALIAGDVLLPHTSGGLAALVALGVISHAAGQGLLAVAMGVLPAMFASFVIFLEAIAAAVFGWIILGESVVLIQALGGVFILLGITLSRPAKSDGQIL